MEANLLFSHPLHWVVTSVAALLISLVIFYIAYVAFAIAKRHLKAERGIWVMACVDALKAPVFALIWIVGISISLEIITDTLEWPIMDSLLFVRHSLILIIVVWFMYRFVVAVERRTLAGYGGVTPDITTVNALTKVGMLGITVIALLFVLQILGVPLSGVVAFGGGSALVMGIGARDLMANFFGGWVVIMDKPFKVGDWIRSPDRSIEGNVEYIGWRSTRIRTFEKTALYVPNSVFTVISLENATRMHSRRMKFTLGLRYSDATSLPTITADIEAMLNAHPGIDVQSTLYARLNNIGSSLDLQVCAFSKIVQTIPFQSLQQEVLLNIIAIISKYDADFSTQTLQLSDPQHLLSAKEVT